MSAEPEIRLDELTKDEWGDIVFALKPKMTPEEYDRLWDDFQRYKARKRVN